MFDTNRLARIWSCPATWFGNSVQNDLATPFTFFMKRQSLYFTAPFAIEAREEPLPTPAAHQVLVQTIVSAISPGTETLLYRGQFPQDVPVDETIAALDSAFGYPLKYGYAAVGRVAALGSAVDANAIQLDQLVFAFNPHESHFIADADTLWPLPEGMEPETAVFLPNMETAVSFVMDSQPMIGERTAVFGQGVVGLLTTSLLSQFPLTHLTTLDVHLLRRQWSRQLGADASLDPAAPDVLAQLQELKADLALELSGNPAALNAAIACVGFNGRVLVGSWYGQKQAALNLGGKFHRNQIRLISSQVSHIAPQWRGRWDKSRRWQVAAEQLTRIRPERLITHRFPIAHAAQAYQLLDQQPEEVIQVVFTYET